MKAKETKTQKQAGEIVDAVQEWTRLQLSDYELIVKVRRIVKIPRKTKKVKS